MTDQNNDNYSIIPFNGLKQVLLLQEEAGWTLPRHNGDAPDEINAAMREQLGLITTVLSCVYDRYQDQEREDQHRVYALENHSPDVSPPVNGRLFDRAELVNLPLEVADHRGVLEAWFAEVEGSEHYQKRLLWMRPGWFASATAWIDERLARLGYTRSAPIEQLVAKSWSTVLRVPTTKGSLYFKAPAPAFEFEPALTAMLNQLMPTQFPSVLVIDGERHWMLMQDAGMEIRDRVDDPALLAEALRHFAEMQISLSPHIEALKATGCPDRRLHLLPRLYQEVLQATPFLHIDEPKGLPRSQYEQLLAFSPQLREMCDELASYNVPESLHHDDLHTGNILYNGERYVFIDLAECCLTHPFCSMFIALRVAKYILKYDEQTLERLRLAYLAPWTRYEPIERLRRALEIAHRLGSLYRALFWYNFLSQLEPDVRWMHWDAAFYFLQVFLGTEE
jgi:Phosphotransferase enzyme family